MVWYDMVCEMTWCDVCSSLWSTWCTGSSSWTSSMSSTWCAGTTWSTWSQTTETETARTEATAFTATTKGGAREARAPLYCFRPQVDHKDEYTSPHITSHIISYHDITWVSKVTFSIFSESLGIGFWPRITIVCPFGDGPGFFEVTFDRLFSGPPKWSKMVNKCQKRLNKQIGKNY